VIFVHIQKTAGMTVQRVLRKRFGPSLPVRIYRKLTKDPRYNGDVFTALKSRTAADGFYAGHNCFGIHRHLPKPALYMTFLRDPVSRCISLYEYSKHTPHAFYHKHARNRDLESFLFETGLMECDNGMVRFIAGSETDLFVNRTKFGEIDDQLLETAKRQLDTQFFFLGLQEEFDSAFLLLAKMLGVANPVYLRLNDQSARKQSSDARGGKSRTPQEIRDRIAAGQRFDQALYDHAKARFQSDLAHWLPNLDAELDAFRDRNTRYNAMMAKIYPVWNAMKGGHDNA